MESFNIEVSNTIQNYFYVCINRMQQLAYPLHHDVIDDEALGYMHFVKTVDVISHNMSITVPFTQLYKLLFNHRMLCLVFYPYITLVYQFTRHRIYGRVYPDSKD